MSGIEGPVLFYERRFYCFSNFSSFAVWWRNRLWMTVEHAYQAAKFEDSELQLRIQSALSAHDAKTVAHQFLREWRTDWVKVRLPTMEEILRAKLVQHAFVQKRLIETGDRTIIEDSPKDSFWGWGSDQKGENHLGMLWMKLREEIR